MDEERDGSEGEEEGEDEGKRKSCEDDEGRFVGMERRVVGDI
jgi:hypothetical protein